MMKTISVKKCVIAKSVNGCNDKNMISINKYIIADPKICHGKLIFRGTRVMVWQVLEMLASGAQTDEILKAFPHITQKHILAALEYRQ
jgi:uncharacterized protein (DUF433 family)